MQNKDISIDVSMFITSLKAIKSRISPEEFEDLLETMQEANNKDKLIEYLEKVYEIHLQDTDLGTALGHAYFDVLVDPGEIL